MNGPEMIRVTVVCMISRLIVGTVYWSLVLNAAALPFSIYTNNFINSLCGIPGYVLANYSCCKYGSLEYFILFEIFNKHVLRVYARAPDLNELLVKNSRFTPKNSEKIKIAGKRPLIISP